MEKSLKINSFIVANGDKLPEAQLPFIADNLNNLDDNKIDALILTQFKSPLIALILSIFMGGLAIDRFYIGDTKLGILKILSWFVLIGLIWTIVDLFIIMDRTKKKNFEKIQKILLM